MLTKIISTLSLVMALSLPTTTVTPSLMVEQLDAFYKTIPDSYEKNIQVNQIDELIIGVNEIDFSELKIVCLGDELTYGNGGSDKSKGGKISYCDFLEETLDCKVSNMGLNKTTIGNYYNDYSFVDRQEDIPEDTDIVIIFGGINDYLLQGSYGEFGTIEKKNSYCNGLKTIIENINEKNEDVEIFFVTTYKNDKELHYSDDSLHTSPFKDYMNSQIAIAKKYENVHVIDFYNTGILNSTISETGTKLTSDGFLLNDEGNELMGEHIAANLIITLSESPDLSTK